MNRWRRVLIRNWTGLGVLALMTWHALRPQARGVDSLWMTLGAVGVALNLLVILANDGMPVSASVEEISDEDRTRCHPITPSTRLAFLADWIPVGNHLLSPGDVLLLIGVAIMLLYAAFLG